MGVKFDKNKPIAKLLEKLWKDCKAGMPEEKLNERKQALIQPVLKEFEGLELDKKYTGTFGLLDLINSWGPTGKA